ncbi:TadE/TadG family type IV pilus assembly protein [Magnetovibrio sp. PR-2]|uniref:TadE/TadG family type IV pilus assembly protein n=1 Tax=Magnetovibrio sp. PR-2 TaxID=3120356 RepID=UPI002FCE5C07
MSLKNTFTKWRRCKKGATAVEIALLAPALFLMVYGVIETGRALWISNTLQRAAESATRYAVVNSDASDAQITTQAQTDATGMNSGDLTVNVTHDATGGVNFVTVEVTFDFSVMSGVVPIDDVTLSGRSRVPFNN